MQTFVGWAKWRCRKKPFILLWWLLFAHHWLNGTIIWNFKLFPHFNVFHALLSRKCVLSLNTTPALEPILKAMDREDYERKNPPKPFSHRSDVFSNCVPSTRHHHQEINYYLFVYNTIFKDLISSIDCVLCKGWRGMSQAQNKICQTKYQTIISLLNPKL